LSKGEMAKWRNGETATLQDNAIEIQKGFRNEAFFIY